MTSLLLCLFWIRSECHPLSQNNFVVIVKIGKVLENVDTTLIIDTILLLTCVCLHFTHDVLHIYKVVLAKCEAILLYCQLVWPTKTCQHSSQIVMRFYSSM